VTDTECTADRQAGMIATARFRCAPEYGSILPPVWISTGRDNHCPVSAGGCHARKLVGSWSFANGYWVPL
jgi:hypothetical protein